MWLSHFDKHYGICYTVFNIGKLVNALDKEEFRIKLEEINRLVEKKNYKDGREERKQESIEYAKNKWKSDHTIRVGTLANEIKLKLKITHTSKAIEGWIKKYKPENKK